MSELNPETVGIGAIALALIGLVWKIWKEHSRLTDKVADVLEKNAVSHEHLNQSVKENTQVTKQTRDTFSKLITQILKRPKK